MAGAADELVIRSRHGVLRDLFPSYEPLSIAAALAVVVAVLLLGWLVSWHLPLVFVLLGAIQWSAFYAERPALLALTTAQAERVEATMAEEGHFEQSLIGGRWEVSKDSSWGKSDKVIELVRTDRGVDLAAPRPWLEAIRNWLEWVEEGGKPLGNVDGGEPFQIGEIPEIPRHAKVPGIVLSAIMVPLLIYDLAMRQVGHWGLSGQALASGRYDVILLHMISHGSVMHVVMNAGALLAIGPALAIRLGPPPLSWLRFLLLFVASGLAGAALYLAIHPFGTTPMVGASGAIYGMIGLLVRSPRHGGELMSLRSRSVRRVGLAMIKENAFLFALLALMAWTSGSAGGLAWEAHLGGFLFGFFAGPRLLPQTASPTNGGG